MFFFVGLKAIWCNSNSKLKSQSFNKQVRMMLELYKSSLQSGLLANGALYLPPGVVASWAPEALPA